MPGACGESKTRCPCWRNSVAAPVAAPHRHRPHPSRASPASLSEIGEAKRSRKAHTGFEPLRPYSVRFRPRAVGSRRKRDGYSGSGHLAAATRYVTSRREPTPESGLVGPIWVQSVALERPSPERRLVPSPRRLARRRRAAGRPRAPAKPDGPAGGAAAKYVRSSGSSARTTRTRSSGLTKTSARTESGPQQARRAVSTSRPVSGRSCRIASRAVVRIAPTFAIGKRSGARRRAM